MTITKERLEEIAEDGFLKHGESKELARMALAGMEAEPVGFIARHKETGKFGSYLHPKADWFKDDNYEVLKAYDAPQPLTTSERAELENYRNAQQVVRSITQHFDDIALETAREIMCDVNRRHEFLGGEVQLLSRIQCRIDEACRAAMLQAAEPSTDNTNQQFESLSRGDK